MNRRRAVNIEDLSVEERAALTQRWKERWRRDEELINDAVWERGGLITDYYVMYEKAWRKDHQSGKLDQTGCPEGDNECGYCHKTCDVEDCGICEDRAFSSICRPPEVDLEVLEEEGPNNQS